MAWSGFAKFMHSHADFFVGGLACNSTVHCRCLFLLEQQNHKPAYNVHLFLLSSYQTFTPPSRRGAPRARRLRF